MNKQATSVFDTWAETGLAEGMEEEHAGTVVEAMRLMELRSKETVLDLGSGNGWATRILADITGGPTIGVDGAANMIERATGMSKGYDDISFIHALFESLPLEDATVDRVFSMEALYYAVDPNKVIKEIHRILRPGGKAEIIIDFYRENATTEGWPELLGVPMVWLGENEWAEMFRAAAFTSVETHRITDPNGPGQESMFKPEPWCPTWQAHVEFCMQGSLWIRAALPAD